MILLGFALFIGSTSAKEYMTPTEAFKPSQQGNLITIHIADGYYLYKNKISVQTSSGPVAFNFMNKPIDKAFPNQGTFTVYLDKAKLEVNSKSKMPLTLHFQGCSSKGLCYPPQKFNLKAL